MADRFAR